MTIKKVIKYWSITLLIPVIFSLSVLIALSAWQISEYKLGFTVRGDPMAIGDSEIGFISPYRSSSWRRFLSSGVQHNIYTDSRGARVNKPGVETSEEVDIMTIGGSFSWGQGIENEQTYTELLGKELNMSVANFAKASYGTVQSLQMLQRNRDIKPKIIIYGFITGHIRRNLRRCAPSFYPFCMHVPHVDFDEKEKPILRLPGLAALDLAKKRKRIYSAFKGEFKLSYPIVGIELILRKMEKQRLLNRGESLFENAVYRTSSLITLLDSMQQEANLIDATLIVVYIPLLEEPPPPVPEELLRAVYGKQNVILVDLTKAVTKYLTKHELSSLWIAPSDRHPSAMAHQLIAAEVKKTIISIP